MNVYSRRSSSFEVEIATENSLHYFLMTFLCCLKKPWKVTRKFQILILRPQSQEKFSVERVQGRRDMDDCILRHHNPWECFVWRLRRSAELILFKDSPRRRKNVSNHFRVFLGFCWAFENFKNEISTNILHN